MRKTKSYAMDPDILVGIESFCKKYKISYSEYINKMTLIVQTDPKHKKTMTEYGEECLKNSIYRHNIQRVKNEDYQIYLIDNTLKKIIQFYRTNMACYKKEKLQYMVMPTIKNMIENTQKIYNTLSEKPKYLLKDKVKFLITLKDFHELNNFMSNKLFFDSHSKNIKQIKENKK